MDWICIDCADARGCRIPSGHMATWHMGTCDVCGQRGLVTEPRDFRPRPDATSTSRAGKRKYTAP